MNAKNEWKTISKQTSNIFRLDYLKNKPYKIRIKYTYSQNNKQCIKYSDQTVISLQNFKVKLIWNKSDHGTNINFVNDDRIICKNGHRYTPENTYITPDGRRNCRACIRNSSSEYSRRIKA